MGVGKTVCFNCFHHLENKQEPEKPGSRPRKATGEAVTQLRTLRMGRPLTALALTCNLEARSSRWLVERKSRLPARLPKNDEETL